MAMARADDWKHLPFGAVTAIPYDAEFSLAQFELLQHGLVPQAMEDKWFVYFEAPNLYFHRSWTGQAFYRVTLQPSPTGCAVGEAVCSSEVLDNADPGYHVQLLGFVITNLLLGQARAFPRPAGIKEPQAGVYQHAVAGTRHAERIVARKPWWKFWG
ncbi:hypothetical protein [Sphingomonas sp. MS122]|uniref:hypothetical protein n=1 Tax=Sphingomonas sp. MS122 TaxID=3412683 RepID=UPI003C2C1F94